MEIICLTITQFAVHFTDYLKPRIPLSLAAVINFYSLNRIYEFLGSKKMYTFQDLKADP